MSSKACLQGLYVVVKNIILTTSVFRSQTTVMPAHSTLQPNPLRSEGVEVHVESDMSRAEKHY